MSYEAVLEGLDERFATVSGIAAVLDYEPAAIQDYPLLFSFLDSAENIRSGQVKGWRYRIQHRLVFRWQDREGAELEVKPFVNAIPNAVDADPHLGGRLVSGYAEISEIDAGWDEVAGTLHRVVDFFSTVVDKTT